MPEWLKKAIFYEIYPQSFYDTNGDGIGDIEGIIQKLDYIKYLGANALWINPWYDSPFKDAGYDVRDYKLVAPRYGTNEDAKRLFDEAHKKGIHVLLDLVPGHTSEEHPWFLESKKALKRVDGKLKKNEYSDRYIWSDFWLSGMAGHPYIGGESDRNGTYMLNFFKCQPALNYGFAKPKEKWQMSYKDVEPMKTLRAMMDVMKFWLDMGADGFRVDMANSLVKDDDDDKSCTCSLWRTVRNMLDNQYPEAALVAEWSNPYQAINSAGFHMDFYLDHIGNGYNYLLREYEAYRDPREIPDKSYFKKDSGCDITEFLLDYIPKLNATKDKGFISFITCNHDTPRAAFTLDESELKVAYATLLTLPGVPFIYYGDEIGMRYIEDMPTKEGGYTRTGSRTPMQWDDSYNMGFSKADSDKLYLPVDPEGPNVRDQQLRRDSLLNTLCEILKLRHEEDSLDADSDFEVIMGEENQPFIYRRGRLIILVNPSIESNTINDPGFILSNYKAENIEKLYSIGETIFDKDTIKVGAQSFTIITM